jgi:type IV pilus assembly protein PilA
MNKLLSKLREKRAKGEDGFTLIELLVVVVIIGVLIAIAIPLYLNYRKGAQDAAAESDMHNAVNSLEQCYIQNDNYPTNVEAFDSSAPKVLGDCTSQPITLSPDVTMKYTGHSTPGGAQGDSYMIVANNPNGDDKFYCYNNAKGGQVAVLTVPNADFNTGC